MNRTIISLICLSAIGCKANVNLPPQYPQNTTTPQNTAENKPGIEACPSKDGFDTTGKIVAASGRWVWNESKKAYDYLTSPEMQQKYNELWESTKKFADEEYQEAVKAWDEHQATSADEKKERKEVSDNPGPSVGEWLAKRFANMRVYT